MDATTFKDADIIKMLNGNFLNVKFNAEGAETVIYKNKTYTNPNPSLRRSTHTFTPVILGQRIVFPSYAVLDATHNVIGVINGFQQVDNLKTILTYFIDKAYLHESFENYSKRQ